MYRACSFVIGICTVGLSIATIWGISDFPWLLWSDRDLHRALNKGLEFWFLGPEFTEGTFTPGGFYYFYLGILHWVMDSALGVYQIMRFINAVALLALFWEVRKHTSSASALWATAFLMFQSFTGPQLTQLWNPAFGFSFACVALVFVLKWTREPKTVYLIVAIVLLGLAAQFHFSFLYPTLIVLILSLFGNGKINFSRFSYVFLFLILLYLPYLFYIFFISPDMLNNFSLIAEYKSFQKGYGIGETLVASFTHLYNVNFQPVGVLTLNEGSSIASLLAKASQIIVFLDEKMLMQGVAIIRFLAVVFFQLFLVVGTVVILVDVVRKVNSKKKISRLEWAFMTLLLAVVFTPVLHLVLSGQLRHRYLFWTMPIVMFLTASVLDKLINYTKNIKIKWLRDGHVFVLSMILLVTSTVGLIRVAKYDNKNHFVSMHSNLAEISQDLTTQLRLNKIYWATNVAGFYYENSQSAIDRGRRVGYNQHGYHFSGDYFSYIQGVDLKDEATTENRCILVFKHNSGTPAKQHEVVDAVVAAGYSYELKGLKRAYLGANHAYYTFYPVTYSCPRNLRNNYILLDEEKTIAQVLLTMQSDLVPLPVDSLPDNSKMDRVVLRVGHKYQIGILLDLIQGAEGTHIELNSRDLRGFDGTKSFEFRNPLVTFHALDTKIDYHVPIYQGRFGSSYGGRLLASTPWTVVFDSVPTGRYSVQFSADDFREFSENNWTGSLVIQLFEDVYLK